MYLGEATIYQDRINEFMNIAKDLEVKELSKDDESDEELVNSEADNVDKPMQDDHTRRHLTGRPEAMPDDKGGRC